MRKLIEHLSNHQDFMRVDKIPGIQVDLRYASTNNFMGKNIYKEFCIPFLHNIAANKLILANQYLKEAKPDFSFLLLDCLRPASAHLELWDFVKGTAQESYVANPDKGSLHSFGFAVDLTLVNENAEELDMGTVFDSFHDLAQPRHETKMLGSGQLTFEQHSNRLILRNSMEAAGFHQLSFEWWHYDADDGDYIRKNYEKII